MWMSKQRKLCSRADSAGFSMRGSKGRLGHGIPCPGLIIYSETKSRLSFDHAARQCELGLIESRVSTHSLTGRSQRNVSNGLVAERAEIDLVEQIVEIAANFQFCIFAKRLGAWQPEGFGKGKVHGRIPRAAERI